MTVSVGLEHDAIGVGRDDRRGFLRSHLILGGLRASADEADDLYVTQVGVRPLAPTRLTIVHADDAGPEDRVPSTGLRVSGQRERGVGRPQDVDPLDRTPVDIAM